MKYYIAFKEEVYLEIEEAFEYYENEEKDLGFKLLNAIEKAKQEIQINPLGYQVKYKNYRTKLVKPFPYILIYDIDVNQVTIYQFFCAKKEPNKRFNV